MSEKNQINRIALFLVKKPKKKRKRKVKNSPLANKKAEIETEDDELNKYSFGEIAGKRKVKYPKNDNNAQANVVETVTQEELNKPSSKEIEERPSGRRKIKNTSLRNKKIESNEETTHVEVAPMVGGSDKHESTPMCEEIEEKSMETNKIKNQSSKNVEIDVEEIESPGRNIIKNRVSRRKKNEPCEEVALIALDKRDSSEETSEKESPKKRRPKNTPSKKKLESQEDSVPSCGEAEEKPAENIKIKNTPSRKKKNVEETTSEKSDNLTIVKKKVTNRSPRKIKNESAVVSTEDMKSDEEILASREKNRSAKRKKNEETPSVVTTVAAEEVLREIADERTFEESAGNKFRNRSSKRKKRNEIEDAKNHLSIETFAGEEMEPVPSTSAQRVSKRKQRDDSKTTKKEIVSEDLVKKRTSKRIEGMKQEDGDSEEAVEESMIETEKARHQKQSPGSQKKLHDLIGDVHEDEEESCNNRKRKRPNPNLAGVYNGVTFDNRRINEVKLTSNVPERHLRVVLRKNSEVDAHNDVKFVKMQDDLERDLPIRKRSKLRSYEAQS